MAEITPEMRERIDTIFHKVGRNVVNLQRLEAMLKRLHALNFEAPLRLASQVMQVKKDKISRQTLGPLTHDAIDNLFPTTSPQTEFSNLITEVWVKHDFGFESDDHKELLKGQLKTLVDDRNQLIHHMFGGFDPRAVESCAKLATMLDNQHKRIVEVFTWVQDLADGVAQHHKSAKEAFGTGPLER